MYINAIQIDNATPIFVQANVVGGDIGLEAHGHSEAVLVKLCTELLSIRVFTEFNHISMDWKSVEEAGWDQQHPPFPR
jgi:hypothetical protein